MEIKNDYFTNILDNCDYDFEFLMELSTDLINMFSPDMYESIEKYIKEKDGESVAKLSHKLRGAVVNFNMYEATLLLKQLEHKGKQNDLNGSHEIIEKIRREMAQFSKAIEVYRKEKHII